MDIQVQVLLAPGEDVANQCLSADVYYGDFQVSPGTVTVLPQAGASADVGSVRIQSSLPVNEPIVSLYVRAGCGTAFTRRFVLLADLINEPAVPGTPVAVPAVVAPAAAPVAPPPAPAPVTAPAVAAPTAPAPAAQAPAPRPPKPKVAPASRPPAAKKPVAPAPKPAAPAPAPAPAPAAAPGASRLKLDPPDLGPAAPAASDARPLAGATSAGADASVAAASAAEVALAAANEEARRNAERLAALETEMARFREAQQRDQERIADLTAQLMRAEEQRYQNWVVFLLAGLLLIALAAIAVLARRQQRELARSKASRAWWNGEDPGVDGEPMRPVSRRAPLEPSAPVPLEAVSAHEIDVDLDEDSAPVPLAGRAGAQRAGFASTLPPSERREFAPSASGGSRAVATEELFDIQQQADFFVSLGEEDQAIEVLRNHLTESYDPSPLAYLDLFRLYHRLGRRDEYESLRDEFNRVFNAGAPEFDRYADKGRGLEAYETAMARIQALWPQPRVLDLIERSIFRDMEEGESEVFDLEAYRELLLLHAIASELVERDGVEAGGEFQNTSMQPLKAAGRSTSAVEDDGTRKTVPMDLHVIPPASPAVDIDIDIDDLQAESMFEASLPDVDVPVEPTAGRKTREEELPSLDFDLGFDDAPEGEAPRKRGDDEPDIKL